jgi:hypothetical protein
MMLFDPEVALSIKWGKEAGRQGGGREMMNATVKQRQTGAGDGYLETSEGSYCPRV